MMNVRHITYIRGLVVKNCGLAWIGFVINNRQQKGGREALYGHESLNDDAREEPQSINYWWLEFVIFNSAHTRDTEAIII